MRKFSADEGKICGKEYLDYHSERFDKRNGMPYNRYTVLNAGKQCVLENSGPVKVSTGVMKLEKLSAGDALTHKLKIKR